MSRSYLKRPFLKYGHSDKKDRTIANKKYRRAIKTLICVGEEHFPSMREITSTWDFRSDGLACYQGRELLTNPEYRKLRKK